MVIVRARINLRVWFNVLFKQCFKWKVNSILLKQLWASTDLLQGCQFWYFICAIFLLLSLMCHILTKTVIYEFWIVIWQLIFVFLPQCCRRPAVLLLWSSVYSLAETIKYVCIKNTLLGAAEMTRLIKCLSCSPGKLSYCLKPYKNGRREPAP